MNPQSCYGSPDFKSGPVPLWHRGKTQSTGVEPVSRRNDRLLSGEFQYHYGTIAKVGRVGFAPTMLKSHDFTDRCVTDSAHLPRYPSFLLFCVENGEPTQLREMDLNHRPLAYEANELSAAPSRSGCGEIRTRDSSVKSRLLYQLSYTPVMDHDGVEPPTPRASIWRSTVELTIHKPVTRFRLALLVWKTRILPLDDTSKYSSNTTV